MFVRSSLLRLGRTASTLAANAKASSRARSLALLGTGAVALVGFAEWERRRNAQCWTVQVDGAEMVSKSDFDALLARVEKLEAARVVDVAGRTNSAFLFIKPHAMKGTPGQVQALVESKLAAAGIRITGSGEFSGETIDKEMYIDTHYGAIASKAVKLHPSELNVPDKKKPEFKKMFGVEWEEALAKGLVYNAKDAAEKLGVDALGLELKWRKLTRGKDFIKFGGGFYCGKIDGIYVMNGFYMQMRAAYTTPGERLGWYTVEWPSAQLSWEDFRGTVLGATDPAQAPAGSIRRAILETYADLGLDSKPNSGNNGVHASASPFEGLAERMNWLGASIEDDAFGQGLLAAGVPEATIKKWAADCQVSVDGETGAGKTMSLFDTLEDMNADSVLEKVTRIH